MRIIAGKWRSRRLKRPKTLVTRPVPDRVKQAIFEILAVHYCTPGGLPALRVADVFAGSGSMGLEALSRGAESCWLYERDREALDALRANFKALAVGAEASIVIGDAWRRAVAAPDGQPFDLVLLDPPYADSDDVSEGGPVRRYLERIAGGGGLCPLVVLHHRAEAGFCVEPALLKQLEARSTKVDQWRILDHRIYGTSAVTFFGPW